MNTLRTMMPPQQQPQQNGPIDPGQMTSPNSGPFRGPERPPSMGGRPASHLPQGGMPNTGEMRHNNYTTTNQPGNYPPSSPPPYWNQQGGQGGWNMQQGGPMGGMMPPNLTESQMYQMYPWLRVADEHAKAQQEANQANESRYMDILEGYGDMQNNAAAMVAGVDNRYSDFAQGMTDDYNERYKKGMGYLDNAGQQARQDLNAQYDTMGNNAMSDLTSRGLRTTTVAPSMQMGVERERQNSMGRLNDNLQGQYLNWHSRLSGDTLGARQGMFNQQMGALQGGTGTMNNMSGQRLNFMERRNDVQPNPYGMTQTLGSMGAGAIGQRQNFRPGGSQ